jgi:hypothetical protein
MHYWAFAAVGYVISVHIISPSSAGGFKRIGKLTWA